jgi:hypothetical protein
MPSALSPNYFSTLDLHYQVLGTIYGSIQKLFENPGES